jgi:hypothetical protein
MAGYPHLRVDTMAFFDRHNAAPFSIAGRFIFEALSLDSRFGRMLPGKYHRLATTKCIPDTTPSSE